MAALPYTDHVMDLSERERVRMRERVNECMCLRILRDRVKRYDVVMYTFMYETNVHFSI
jgi:hypothetical protein